MRTKTAILLIEKLPNVEKTLKNHANTQNFRD